MVVRFERDEFIASRWAHRWGEHVTILAPSGWGKSTLALQLLEPLSTPRAPTWVLCMKRRDTTVSEWGKAHQFRRTEAWPPAPALDPRKPAGYLVWPKVTGKVEDDEYRQFVAFEATIQKVRAQGKGAKVLADELADLTDIGLRRQVSSALRQGRSEDAAIFSATQRPFDIPGLAYGQAMHLFIGNDTDKRSRDRYGEIGGIDKNLLIDLTSNLDQREFLYIRRARAGSKTRMCIVGA